MPERSPIKGRKIKTLRYGENPHQKAALHGDFFKYYKQLSGKELSYNNIVDLTAATHAVLEFPRAEPAVVIVKHTNPCGVGVGRNVADAWRKAYATDTTSAFGGVVATNAPIDVGGAQAIGSIFTEVVVAPKYSNEALALLMAKKNLRVMQLLKDPRVKGSEVRSVGAGSYVSQTPDRTKVDPKKFNVVTKRTPTAEETKGLVTALRVAKHVKSNAIIFAVPDRTLGIGAGQMSRIDSTEIAARKAAKAGIDLKGSALASDAFFPFPDGVIAAIDAGATAIAQPGGSIKDAEVIAAADERGVTMVFTGTRHFKH